MKCPFCRRLLMVIAIFGLAFFAVMHFYIFQTAQASGQKSNGWQNLARTHYDGWKMKHYPAAMTKSTNKGHLSNTSSKRTNESQKQVVMPDKMSIALTQNVSCKKSFSNDKIEKESSSKYDTINEDNIGNFTEKLRNLWEDLQQYAATLYKTDKHQSQKFIHVLTRDINEKISKFRKKARTNQQDFHLNEDGDNSEDDDDDDDDDD
ncbi:unnamed protein product [Clavelina lepadiformis]|uniref:Uncharacterized protein n=1 Tax=Clavelina lepadiformis TaxID=159417 RepID=A0ABP0H2K8_CLALP